MPKVVFSKIIICVRCGKRGPYKDKKRSLCASCYNRPYLKEFARRNPAHHRERQAAYRIRKILENPS